MKNLLKVGLIGLGEHMWENLLPSISFNKNVIIDSVCDIDENKLKITKQKYNVEIFHSYEDMISTRNLDCLVVASYPQVHYEIIKLALDKGIPIFVEKPPTMDILQLKEVLQYANANSLVSGVGINFSYAESLLIIKELLKKKSFGNIMYINISHLANKPIEPLWELENLSQSFLLAQAIHPLSFILNFGDTYEVKAVDYIQHGKILFLNLNLKISNDSCSFTANVTSGTCAPHFEWRMELITDKQKIVRVNSLWELELLDAKKYTNLIDDPKRWKDVWHPSAVGNGLKRNGYYNELVSFFECVELKKTFHPNIPDMLNVYQLMNQIEGNLIFKN